MKTPFRGFTAILLKEFTVVFRDPTTLFFMFFPPLMQIIAFGYALDNDVRNIRVVVLDQDRTFESRLFTARLQNTGTFKLTGEVGSVEELSAAIRQGKAYVGVQIPPDFTRNLRAARNAQVQVLIDGSSSTIAMQALQTSMGLALRESLLTTMREAGRRELPLEVRPQILYNPTMKSANFFVPGVMGLALQIATMVTTALSLVRERERGTLENLLVSPLSRAGLMLGKLVPYLCTSMAMATCIFLVARWVFQIPIRGAVPALFVAAFLYIFALLSVGLLISTVAQNHMQALQMCMALILPSVFFSGFIFPIENMPRIFQWLSACIPATYFIELMRAIMLRGASIADYLLNYAVLSGMALGFFALCVLRFRQRLG
ncbi:MAG: ABC transporter permease [Verrucomicrobiae bacterium]|nr:ABC transporter permease [Verrucomicrobiae bacterium]MDW7979563.1 ABC transporter permease [Verrucomicrobiales bacterium]